MRVLFITDNFPPEVNAPATRTYEHCVEWVKAGIDVTVLTCFPNYPQGKLYPGYKNKLYQVEYINGIKVIRLWSYMTRNEGFIKRVIDYISFAFMAFWAGLFKKTDIIVATSPQFFTTITGYLLSVIKRKPWVFELRDLWPDSIRAVNIVISKSKLLDWFERVELFLYRRSAKVIALTDAFKKNLIERGIPGNKIEIVTNGVNMERFEPRSKNACLIESLGLNGKFVVGYLGTHGMSHGLDFVLNAIARHSLDNMMFLFIGDGAEKSKLLALAKELQLNNVCFLEPVSKEQISDYISIMDVALVPLRKRDVFKTVIPSKIFEMASMRKPILLGVEGQAQEIIERHKAGLCFEPENEIDFINKLKQLSADKELYGSLQHGCDQLAANYNRKKLANKMLHDLKNCLV